MATTTHGPGAPGEAAAQPRTIERRLDDIGWGVFLLMTGVLWIASDIVPSGTWLLGTGGILLALNAVRSAKGLALNAFTLVLGVLAIIGGLADLANVRVPIFALALAVFGVMLIAKPLLTRRNRGTT